MSTSWTGARSASRLTWKGKAALPALGGVDLPLPPLPSALPPEHQLLPFPHRIRRFPRHAPPYGNCRPLSAMSVDHRVSDVSGLDPRLFCLCSVVPEPYLIGTVDKHRRFKYCRHSAANRSPAPTRFAA